MNSIIEERYITMGQQSLTIKFLALAGTSSSGSEGASKFVETWIGGATSDDFVEEWRKSSACKASVAGARSLGGLRKAEEESEEGREQEGPEAKGEAGARDEAGPSRAFG